MTNTAEPQSPALSLVQAWKLSRERLTAAGIEQPVIDARLLLETAAGVSRIDIVTDPYRMIGEEQTARLQSMLARRIAREPVSQIIGKRGFWKHDFVVTRDVLTPRPETETLVERALRLMSPEFDGVLIDLGTGSGAIALSLLAERPRARAVALDTSPAALSVAAENATLFGLSDRLTLIEGSWNEEAALAAVLAASGGAVPIVLSNPPYIAQWEMPLLQPEVRDHEPHLALVAGADGLDAYRELGGVLPRLLRADGQFVLEIGATQAEAVHVHLDSTGLLQVDEVVTDLSNRPRVVIGRRR